MTNRTTDKFYEGAIGGRSKASRWKLDIIGRGAARGDEMGEAGIACVYAGRLRIDGYQMQAVFVR